VRFRVSKLRVSERAVQRVSNELVLLMLKTDASCLGELFMVEVSGMRVTTAIFLATWPDLVCLNAIT
jgi:hypothetical protein